jgi:hypothetical protein
MLLCAAISWAKKAFRKYFDKEENHEKSHQYADKILKAPTVAITRDIVQWIESVEYWCGEKGNYTNATPGCVGNCMASGIESLWRYAKRDIVGISLEVSAMQTRN